ncbi:hypothetical protein GQ43DRAFT_444513 [Delitschia confertaspora ATCC 74209]|uniref:Fungal specific transcription factor n=1 Tax=Delitschia confertaspora ATCC 74209 TaxID=1513339 RepID=A0A9P4JH70_9PLEO|nr:hypothetical protein GQ43DRAFT_444513 [Delitschia confertaspora ATCC 74209]
MSTTNPPSTTTPSDISSSPSHSGQNPGSSQPLPLPEPPKDTNAATLDVSSGQGVKLDHLGPMVVNRDGTLSRIANWTEMSDIERKNTLRILGKRNQLRINALKNDDNKD